MTEFINLIAPKKEARKTELTHCLQTVSNTWYKTTSRLDKYEKIVYLGDFLIDSVTRNMFACYHKNGYLELWAGIKGDEFNS